MFVFDFSFTKVTSSISLSFNMAGVFHYCYIHNSSLVMTVIIFPGVEGVLQRLGSRRSIKVCC